MEQLLNNLVDFFQSAEVQTFVSTILIPSGLGGIIIAVITKGKSIFNLFKSLLDKSEKDGKEKLNTVVQLYGETHELTKTVYEGFIELKENNKKYEDKTKRQDALIKTLVALVNIPVAQKQAILEALLDETNTDEDKLTKALISTISGQITNIKENSNVQDTQLTNALNKINDSEV